MDSNNYLNTVHFAMHWYHSQEILESTVFSSTNSNISNFKEISRILRLVSQEKKILHGNASDASLASNGNKLHSLRDAYFAKWPTTPAAWQWGQFAETANMTLHKCVLITRCNILCWKNCTSNTHVTIKPRKKKIGEPKFVQKIWREGKW